MAIHPIDLSTMYGQMENISKFNASQNQMTQAMNSTTLINAAQNDQVKAKTVQETNNDKGESGQINENGRGGSSDENPSESSNETKSKEKNNEKENTPVPEKKLYEIKDPRLGHHIDITG